MYKKTFLWILLFSLIPLAQIKADGCMIPMDYQDGDIYEPSQTALIVHKDGKEDLYLKVNYEGETNNFVWIVPTPTYPEAEKAAKDIFTELSALTTTAHWRTQDSLNTGSAKGVDYAENVVVHSQENIGIYEVTVLSATGVDGLFDWLNNNGYKLKDEVKDMLAWYIEKEWYFTAMRIKPENILNQAIEDLKQIDSEVNKDNFSEKLSKHYIESFKNNNFDQFKIAYPIIMTVLGVDYSEKITEDLFNQIFNDEDTKKYIENGWLEPENEIKKAINTAIERRLNIEKVSKYSDYIEPIKISFKTNTIVYPLKISQISTRVPEDPSESSKTNEILLYVLADEQVKAPGFVTEYAQTVDMAKLEEAEKNLYSEDLESLKKIIETREYFLTKIRRDFAKIEMDEDLYLINGKNTEETAKVDNFLLKSLVKNYEEDPKYSQAKNKVYGSAMADRLKGKIVLKVEDDGKAYYINPATQYSHYLGRPDDAFSVMRDQGIGITNMNLEKIPMAFGNLTGIDSDGDGLSDLFEDAIGSDKNKSDTDGDGYDDKAELTGDYNPNGTGKLNFNNSFSNNQKGKIFLQVENNGEAWYVNPEDGKRYFLGRPSDAFQVMRNLGLGISNSDFNKL